MKSNYNFGYVNYYFKRTEDMLFANLSIPSSSGFGSFSYQNAGTMANVGWDFNFNANKFLKVGDFSLSASLNFSNTTNTIIELKQSILDAIENYKNKNIPQQYIDVIVEKMKASINEFVSNK